MNSNRFYTMGKYGVQIYTPALAPLQPPGSQNIYITNGAISYTFQQDAKRFTRWERYPTGNSDDYEADCLSVDIDIFL